MATTIERTPQSRSDRSATSRLLAGIRRHCVVAFYGLAFAFTWGGLLLIVGPDGFFATGLAIAGVAALTFAGPVVSGLLMAGLVDGRAGPAYRVPMVSLYERTGSCSWRT